ncbi:1-(5-phosphoribosyl)-5-[(5-phosphoribosylamino)methylideneamino]imidazole-4-carboxamide isomerase [uncultured Mailhella sp.]|uniref:1-(5-phosphoribosyl)-5-[(5- phosphoribosylamino)methylideneamino]imidazole-4- carboxamide isomerase n=1 Tax=uncultured Mailhella sp. TaxID=1981031 RepID=UPI002618D702|nr:1-(5-phosphoribosyl)-5-[(5-phosphoribosylamino)methylideneamino]imidazole-4-carboxamide isomerase [uncultured Mailhella sp.]
MIIFPAVDLQGGKAVRLKQGKADQSTVFNEDPVAAALHWQEQGAEWLHLIDLDGAFQGRSVNAALVAEICKALDIPVELGGGVRDESAARLWFDAGVERLIIGTLALEAPKAYARLCALFPGRIGVSLDAVDGRLKTRGWVADAGLTVDEVLPRLVDDGTAFIIYTDIARDGMQSGVNLPMLQHLAEVSPVPVVAAGGVATLDDIKALYPLSVHARLQGAISGRAIYEGTLNLPEAIAWIRAQG